MTLPILTALFIVSIVIAEIFYHFRYPRVIGYIVAGILLGLPFFKNLINAELLSIIEFLSEIGVMFLFLLIGLEIDIDKFKNSSKASVVVGLLGFMIPFFLALSVMLYFGFDLFVAVIIGTALAISAEATTAQLLLEMKAIKTRVGNILLGAGLVDDLIGVVMLTVILALKNGHDLTYFPVKLIGFVILIWLSFKAISLILHHLQHEESSISSFSFVIAFTFLIAISANYLGFGEIIGSFLAGMMINFLGFHKCTPKCQKHCHLKSYALMQKRNTEELKTITLSFIIPFFFIYTGLHFDLLSLGKNLWLFAGITVLAISGKFLGVFVARFFSKFSYAESSVIAWGMNSRGAIELVIAQIALSAGLIDEVLYTALVGMALVTTLVFPFFMKRIFQRHPELLKK